MSIFRTARTGAGLLGRAGSAISRAVRGSSTPTRVAVGLTGGAVFADNTVIPAFEAVTGQSVPGSGWTRSAVSAMADRIGGTLGEGGGTLSRSTSEGLTRGLLRVGDEEASGLVTVALLVIGATFFLSLVRR